MVEAYHYVRFRWWTRLELERVGEELDQRFEVKMTPRPGTEHEMAILKDDRSELVVRSDTLVAHLSPFRAVLTQRSPAPFTPNDMSLRKKVLELYPQDRPTPFPWEFSHEPKFEVAEKD